MKMWSKVVVGCLVALSLTGGRAEAAEQLIIINKHDNSLNFYKEGYHIRSFSVATGRSASMTPEGTFSVVNKVKNMPYYKTNIPGGDPSNPLGNRWIGLDVPGTSGYTYGMHGTNMEWTIGTYASSGCVRMYNREVQWLFERVEEGAKVLITNQAKTANRLAREAGTPVHLREAVRMDRQTITGIPIYNRANGEVYTVAPPLSELTIVAQKGDWYQLPNLNGNERWIKKSHYTREYEKVQRPDLEKIMKKA